MKKLPSKIVNREKQLLKLIDISKVFIDNTDKEINYQKITDDMLELCDAKYVGFNLYDSDGLTTVAISGAQDNIKEATNILHFRPVGMCWKYDKVKIERNKGQNVSIFKCLYDLTSDIIPKENVELIEDFFGIGQVVVVKIIKDKKSLGDFTIIMSKDKTFENKEIAELYASQVGLYIEKVNANKIHLYSKKKLENIIQGTNAGTWEWNVQTGETLYNERWAEILGYNLEEILPTNLETWNRFLHPDDLVETEKGLKEVFNKKREYYSLKCRLKHKDGHWVWVLDRGKVVSWTEDEKPLLMFGTLLDISEIEYMENEIRKSEDNYRVLVESSYDIIYRLSPEGVFTYVSKACSLLLGYSSELLLGKTFEQFIHLDDSEQAINFFNKVKESNTRQELTDFRLKNINGYWHWFSTNAVAIRDELDCVIGIAGTARDCNDDKEKQKQVEYLSFHDYLTGLYNRRYMEESVKKFDNERYLPFTIICIDVNGLKLTNDAYGHEMGDKLLRTAAVNITSACRENDIICRVGGDEFAILLPNTDATQAESIKKRITATTKETKIDSVIVSLAIGYATKTNKSQNIAEIQRLADNNMYKNKLKHGKTMRGKTIETVLSNINNKYDKEKIHTERTSRFCESIARELKLSSKEVEDARISGILHDIGKIIVPQEILNKTGKLNKEELEIIRKHPVTGYQILKSVDEFSYLAEAVLYHHERLDGTGYPEKLKGEKIPLLSKIITVADAYEAMTSERNYKKIMDKEQAIMELKRCTGTQFDLEIVQVFVEKVLK